MPRLHPWQSKTIKEKWFLNVLRQISRGKPLLKKPRVEPRPFLNIVNMGRREAMMGAFQGKISNDDIKKYITIF